MERTGLGTNGMGTCLTTQAADRYHRAEHFLAQNIQLTCSAHRSSTCAGNCSPHSTISPGASANAQTHTLALVDMAARRTWKTAHCSVPAGLPRCCASHRCAEFVSTPGEGVVAFDSRDDQGANRSALELLRFRDHETLFGQRVDHVFETSSRLAALAARTGSARSPCRRPRGGDRGSRWSRRRWNRRGRR